VSPNNFCDSFLPSLRELGRDLRGAAGSGQRISCPTGLSGGDFVQQPQVADLVRTDSESEMPERTTI
jgi:hypothetical protein